MTAMDDLTRGITGILGAGIMLKAADMTLDMFGNSKKRKRKNNLWGW